MPLQIYVCKVCGEMLYVFDEELVDGQLPVKTQEDGHTCEFEATSDLHVVGCTKHYSSPHRQWDKLQDRNKTFSDNSTWVEAEKKNYAFHKFLKK